MPKLFGEPGGDHLRTWIDNCPNSLYAALTFQGGAAWRRRLTDDLGEHPDALQLLETMSDDELARRMENLGGHCLPSILDAFGNIDHDRPVVFIAYTTKGWGTPLAGHKDNHAGLMSPEQMAEFQETMGIPVGKEWDPLAGFGVNPAKVKGFLADVPFKACSRKQCKPAPIPVPGRTMPLSRSAIRLVS